MRQWRRTVIGVALRRAKAERVHEQDRVVQGVDVSVHELGACHEACDRIPRQEAAICRFVVPGTQVQQAVGVVLLAGETPRDLYARPPFLPRQPSFRMARRHQKNQTAQTSPTNPRSASFRVWSNTTSGTTGAT